jgi:hypothetical protein
MTNRISSLGWTKLAMGVKGTPTQPHRACRMWW